MSLYVQNQKELETLANLTEWEQYNIQITQTLISFYDSMLSAPELMWRWILLEIIALVGILCYGLAFFTVWKTKLRGCFMCYSFYLIAFFSWTLLCVILAMNIPVRQCLLKEDCICVINMIKSLPDIYDMATSGHLSLIGIVPLITIRSIVNVCQEFYGRLVALISAVGNILCCVITLRFVYNFVNFCLVYTLLESNDNPSEYKNMKIQHIPEQGNHACFKDPNILQEINHLLIRLDAKVLPLDRLMVNDTQSNSQVMFFYVLPILTLAGMSIYLFTEMKKLEKKKPQTLTEKKDNFMINATLLFEANMFMACQSVIFTLLTYLFPVMAVTQGTQTFLLCFVILDIAANTYLILYFNTVLYTTTNSEATVYSSVHPIKS